METRTLLEVCEGSVCFGGGFWFVWFGVVLFCFAQALEPQFSNQECLGSLTADVPHHACQTLHKVFICSITWSLCRAPSTCVSACLGKQKWRGEQSSSAGVISTLLTTRSYSWLTVLKPGCFLEYLRALQGCCATRAEQLPSLRRVHSVLPLLGARCFPDTDMAGFCSHSPYTRWAFALGDFPPC